MYSGDGPPSFSSAGGKHTGDQEPSYTGFHFQSSTGDISGQLPSYGAFGHGQENSQNELLPDMGVYRGIGQTAGNVNGNDEASSFSALGHGHGNSHNHDGTYFNRIVGYSDGGGGAPSVGKMRHVGDSQPSGPGPGNGGDVFSVGKMPSMSDVGKRENSQNGLPLSIDDQTANLVESMMEVSKMPSMSDVERRENSQNELPLSIDDQTANLVESMMEMSLVGKNFTKLFPLAYGSGE